MIELRHLQKYFNKGKQNEIHVINDISLSLPERGMVAIFGRSGCGKTTLLNVIGGLDGFESGSLTIEGEDILQDTDGIRNRSIGYIFQNYNLTKELSCYDNVANALRLCGMPEGEEMAARVRAALLNVGMEHYAARTPDTLSGGQQQRIAIARAIVKNPRIILADEPTGNLDEANTVLVMDLLKQFSRDHLVLLVTHEAHLVDHYCDTVIELSDGRVVSTRQNESAKGFSGRDKNRIYLGELERSTLTDANAEIEYYGECPKTPVKLRIVHHEGTLYLQVDTPGVHLLDEGGEIRLEEGCFRPDETPAPAAPGVDMTVLPPITGNRTGRLFTLSSSLKSGYTSLFQGRKRGKVALRRCLALFAAVLVVMSAVFGTSVGELAKIRDSYNHNVFYLYSGDAEISRRINEAVDDPESGIDYLRLSYTVPRDGDMELVFYTDAFETFSSMGYHTCTAVPLGLPLAAQLPVVAGTGKIDDGELLITTAVADALLKTASVGYLKSYEDLPGLICPTLAINGKSLRVAGVVRSDETAVYLTELAMARYVLGSHYFNSDIILLPDTNADYDVAPGEIVLGSFVPNGQESESPAVGETVMLQGRPLLIKAHRKAFAQYEQWLSENGISKMSMEDYLASEGLTPEQHVYHFMEYYYDMADDFLRDRAVFDGSLELWLYTEKGVEAAKYLFIGGEEYYKALCYRERYNRFPTPNELSAVADTLPSPEKAVDEARYLYEEEFYAVESTVLTLGSTLCVVDVGDYIALSKQTGPTTLPRGASDGMGDYDKPVVSANEVVSSDVMLVSNVVYTVIHASDVRRAAAYLNEHFGDVMTPATYLEALKTPETIFDALLARELGQIVSGLVAMGIILAVMSVCMYFIMRSALMNRVKEVGIYRAIGVSRRNLIFRFLVESAVLTTLTVAVGYLAASLFVYVCLGLSALVELVFFYPVWMAILLIVLLYALCLTCGTLPILLLLRKTPSEILAKYDI